MIALIPARAGSKRVPNKNMRPLNGHPLLAYTIAAAQQSGVFENVIVCSDDELCWQQAVNGGAQYFERDTVTDDQPDVTWIREVIDGIPRFREFAILRPTSPFRTSDTIRRAYREFQAMADCGDSIRAVEPVTQTPYKMWTWAGPGYPIRPLIDHAFGIDGVPYHSCPTQRCPKVWIQTSSLEMAYTANVEIHGTIHGKKVGPFFVEGPEAFSIDTEDDWAKAVAMAKQHPEWLPHVA